MSDHRESPGFSRGEEVKCLGPHVEAWAYLDNAASTPVLPEVAEAMLAVMRPEDGRFANPSSVHRWGLAASQALAAARRVVADAVGATPGEIVFTSGGTEANHLAIGGVARARARQGRHVITTAIEHRSVLDACTALEAQGWEISRLPVGRDGRVRPADVAAAVRPGTVLCTLAHVNNEVGAVQPVAEVAAALRLAGGAALHVDGVQALGKVPTPYAAWGVTLASLSAHKIGGPKGCGALYVRQGTRLVPPVGGEQEGGLRPGTENVPGIVGLGQAVRLLPRWTPGLAALKRSLVRGLLLALPGLAVNGPDWEDETVSAPHIVNLDFSEVSRLPAEVLLHAFEAHGVASSAGSACSARRPGPSHVLTALGLPGPTLQGSLRFSLGPTTGRDEVELAVRRIPAALVALGAAAR